tara:strand:- start:3272 stop:3736 length:465 start_codon:yes stop_codon:yes gene_type:complete
MITIRLATADDFMALYRLGEAMRQEAITHFPKLDAKRASEFLDMAIEQPDTARVVVAEDDEGLIGMMTSMMGGYAFSYEKKAVSDLLFVLPEKRGAIAAKKLVQDFIQWAKDNDAPAAFIGVSTGTDNERTGKFFEKMGFHHMGLSYKMELNHV